MSDWEKRPLRHSQMHYASLDAYCMVAAVVHLFQRNDCKVNLKKDIYQILRQLPKADEWL